MHTYASTYIRTYMFVRNFSRSRSQQRLRYRNLRLPPLPSDCEVGAVVDPFGWIHFIKVLWKGTLCVHTYVHMQIYKHVHTIHIRTLVIRTYVRTYVCSTTGVKHSQKLQFADMYICIIQYVNTHVKINHSDINHSDRWRLYCTLTADGRTRVYNP